MKLTKLNKFEDSVEKNNARNAINHLCVHILKDRKDKDAPFIFGSLPGENGNQEIALFERLQEQFQLPVELYCYELNPKIFKKFAGFDSYNKVKQSKKLKVFQTNNLTINYVKNAFDIHQKYDAFWADYCGTPIPERVHGFAIDVNNLDDRCKLAAVTLSFPRESYKNRSIDPEILESMRKLQEQGLSKNDSFLEAVTTFFESRIAKPKKLVFKYSYYSCNAYMITLAWHLVENSQMKQYIKDATKNQIKEMKTVTKTTQVITETISRDTNIININAIARDLLKKHGQDRSNEIAHVLNISPRSMAAIKANVNRS